MRHVFEWMAVRLPGGLMMIALGLTGVAATADEPAPAAGTKVSTQGPSSSNPTSGTADEAAAGKLINPFFVRAVTGPHRNRSVCYVCRYGSRPVVMVLLQRVDRELPRLLKAIDAVVDQERTAGLRSFGVLITDESSQAVPVLQTMAFDEKIEMPLTAATSTLAESAGLNPQSATTIVLYRDQRAVETIGLRSGAIDTAAITRVEEAIHRLLHGPVTK